MKKALSTAQEDEASEQGAVGDQARRTPPRLVQMGRAFSEMSPLNPASASPSSRSASSAAAGVALQIRRDSGNYGSMFPFGFLRLSLQKTGSSIQVKKKTILPTTYVWYNAMSVFFFFCFFCCYRVPICLFATNLDYRFKYYTINT